MSNRALHKSILWHLRIFAAAERRHVFSVVKMRLGTIAFQSSVLTRTFIKARPIRGAINLTLCHALVFFQLVFDGLLSECVLKLLLLLQLRTEFFNKLVLLNDASFTLLHNASCFLQFFHHLHLDLFELQTCLFKHI